MNKAKPSLTYTEKIEFTSALTIEECQQKIRRYKKKSQEVTLSEGDPDGVSFSINLMKRDYVGFSPTGECIRGVLIRQGEQTQVQVEVALLPGFTRDYCFGRLTLYSLTLFCCVIMPMYCLEEVSYLLIVMGFGIVTVTFWWLWRRITYARFTDDIRYLLQVIREDLTPTEKAKYFHN